ncbi:hypothetical protein HGRIS_001413 [Hohenbuehelia grisea]|uniref:Uncharacterized protein n=1 Tax=Hohenbuehelia grisea TaxID=104357 RepID=A0ABR3JPF7_9AGAR
MDIASSPHDPIHTSVGLGEQEVESSRPLPRLILVERSPTPPLPNFCVDKTLFPNFAGRLRESTDGLNVEHLEQLRATCLGSVWRHRTEWERDELVKELVGAVSLCLRWRRMRVDRQKLGLDIVGCNRWPFCFFASLFCFVIAFCFVSPSAQTWYSPS